MLCVQCGGNGFYLLIDGFPDSNITNRQGDLVACDCENGYKYSKMLKDNGNIRQSIKKP